MKKYRKIIHSFSVFISTLYVLILASPSGPQNHLKSMVIRGITALLPEKSKIIEYEIYIAILPLLILWIVVFRLTHMSKEEKDIEHFKRDKSNQNCNNSQI